ncbi:hypothetical protein G6735_04755 [Polynucleobacter paneuropaeus]|nr:hypothetical protein [Polynucleobacter paneuropaeus]
MKKNSFTPNKMPSNQKFGWFFTALSAILCAYFSLKSKEALFVIFGGASIALALLVIVAPNILYPLNKAWYVLGLLLGKIISPIILGCIFFMIITPIAILMRLFGRDALLLKERKVASFWITKEHTESDTFKNQF